MNVEPPYALLLELTHRCPLHCLYCSNPLLLTASEEELVTDDWLSIIEQAAALGVLQIHLSGGEPLVRTDLERIVERCSNLDLFSNLVTSGIGLDERRIENLETSGLDSVQLSFQAFSPEISSEIAGGDFHERKLQAARLLMDSTLSLTLNCVINRMNIDELESIVEMCTAFGARRIELANAQYHGWAMKNVETLLPSRLQLEAAHEKFQRLKTELSPRVELVWVYPDYYGEYPKACMGGWAKHQMTIAPDGYALPCPAARSISNLEFSSVRFVSLETIWYESSAFGAFRGTDWMVEPCRSCERKEIDFGGCRCQAFSLTGSASNTDPACSKSKMRDFIIESVDRANGQEIEKRTESSKTSLEYRSLGRR